MSNEQHLSTRANGTATDRVTVSLPARPEFVAICRLALAGLGSSTGLDLEQVADLKLAVTEACTHVIGREQGACGSLQVDFEVSPDRWTIEVRGEPGSQNGPWQPSALADEDLGLVVMRALVDEVSLEESHDSGAVLRLVKRF